MSEEQTSTTRKPARQTHAATVSKLVTELLQILDVNAPLPGEEEVPPVVREPGKLDEEIARLAAGVKAQLEGAYKTNPAGITTKEGEALDAARKKLQELNTALESDTLQVRRVDHMPKIKEATAEIAAVFRSTKDALGKREQQRQDLRSKLGNLLPGPVEGATEKENADLIVLRDKILAHINTNTVNADVTKMTKGFQIGTDYLSKFGETVNRRIQAVADRRDQKADLLKRGLEVQEPEGGTPGALSALRDKLTLALDKSPLDDEAIGAGKLALGALTAQRDLLEAQLAPLRRRRVAALAQLGEIKQKAELFTGNIKKTTGEDITSKLAACRTLLDYPLTEDKLDKFNKAFWALRSEITNVAAANYSNQQALSGLRAYMEAEASRLKAEAASIPSLGDTELEGLQEDADAQYAKFRDAMKKTGGAALSTGRAPLQYLLADVGELRSKSSTAALQLSEDAARISENINGFDIKSFAPKYLSQLDTLRKTIATTLTAPLSVPVVDLAGEQAERFRTLYAEAGEDQKAEAKQAKLSKQLQTTFQPVKDNAPGLVQVELQVLLDDAAQRASLTGGARDMFGAAALYEKLVARLAEAKKEKPIPETAFAGITVGTQPVEASVRTQVQGLCSEAAFAKLDADAKKGLCEAVAADGPAIKALFEDGFGGDSGVANALILEGDGKGLSELARAFAGSDSKEARETLRAMVQDGGLAESPRALVAMLKQGVDTAGRAETTASGRKSKQDEARTQNAQAIKGLCATFKDKESRAALRGLLGDCGLGGGATTAPAIGSLLRDGCKGDAGALLTFGKAFEGTDKQAKTDRANVKHLVDKAGVGEHPSVFGPLIHRAGDKKTGTDDMKNSAAKLKGIGQTFASDEDAARLKGLLDGGGMSGDILQPGKEHEHPDTLGKIFQHGMDGDPAKLKRFTKAFDGHRGECKDMLDGFNDVKDGYAAFRQPGKKMKKLLDGKFGGKIESLQTVFTTNIKSIADEPTRRQAIRFAPHVADESENEHVGDFGSDVTKVTASVEGRHKPETFAKSRMKATAPNSLFPPNLNTEKLLTDTLAALGAGVNKSTSHQPSIPIKASDLGFGEDDEPGFASTASIKVEVGFLSDDVVNHFGPRDDQRNTPFETPKFTTAAMTTLLASIGK